jgi:hypothetical protein
MGAAWFRPEIRSPRWVRLTVMRSDPYIGFMSPETRRNRNNQLSIDHAVT